MTKKQAQKQLDQKRRKFRKILIALCVVLGLAMAGAMFAQEPTYQMTKPAAEEFCGGLVSTQSMHYAYCVRMLEHRTTARDLSEITLTTVTPEIYPALLDAGTAPAAPGPPVSLAISVKAANSYLGGNGGIFHAGEVVQTDLFFSFRNGWYGDLWHSAGLDDNDLSSNYGDELDWSAGRAGVWRGFGYDVGVIYIDAVGLGRMPNGDVWGPYLKLSRELGACTPSLKLESYIPGGTAIEGGWLIHGRVACTKTTTSGFATTLSLGPTYDDGAFGFLPGTIGVGELSLSIPWRGVTLSPFYKIATPILGADDRQTEDTYGLTLGTTF